jgi:hypothetical protein
MREIRLGDDRVRLIGEAVRAQDQRLIVIVGQSLEDRAGALDNLAGVLLIGGPAALLLASLAGYLLTGAALAPVEAMRRRAAEISADVVPASVELRRWRSSRLVRSRWDLGECEQVHRDEENRHEDRRAGAGR